MKLDLACGQRKQPDHVGVDCVALPGVDLVLDLERYPWPFEDSSVAEIYCSHYVEHVSDLMRFFNECHRILIPGGTMQVICPYYTSIRCWQDPTHKHAISEHTFLYYNKKWREDNGLGHYPITADFEFTFAWDVVPELAEKSREEQLHAIRHEWNVVADISVSLTKRS